MPKRLGVQVYLRGPSGSNKPDQSIDEFEVRDVETVGDVLNSFKDRAMEVEGNGLDELGLVLRKLDQRNLRAGLPPSSASLSTTSLDTRLTDEMGSSREDFLTAEIQASDENEWKRLAKVD